MSCVGIRIKKSSRSEENKEENVRGGGSFRQSTELLKLRLKPGIEDRRIVTARTGRHYIE